MNNIFTTAAFLIGITITIGSNLNNAYDWDPCTNLLLQIQNCTQKLHLPETCDRNRKSELRQCAEEVLHKLPVCRDPTAALMLKNYRTIYKLSDEIICQKKLHLEFRQNKKCLMAGSHIAMYIGSVSPGTLSTKGCRYLYSALYLAAINNMGLGCFDVLEKYIIALYNQTFCASALVQPPTYSHVKGLKRTISALVKCWIRHPSLPPCKNQLSNRLQCVKHVNVTMDNENFQPLITNIVDVTKYTDEIICKNPKLQDDFNNNRNCWDQAKLIGVLVLGQANGLLTEEGCSAVKFRENITMATFDKSCTNLLLDYRKYMDEVLPCTKKRGINFAHSMKFANNDLYFNLVISFVLIMHLKIN